MIFNDLREWMDQVEKMNELECVEGADCEQEIGALTDLFQKEMNKPALLFDAVKDYPKGYRILANTCASLKRVALTLNLDPDLSAVEIVQEWRNFLKGYEPIKPEVVSSGSVMENVFEGNDVDLSKFPIPKWHEKDGGKYLGTGCIVVTRDPENGLINCGTYRMMYVDSNKCTIFMVPGKHGDIMARKYWEQGKPFPVAVSLGHDPLYWLIGGLEVPFNVSEYDFIGAVRNQAVKVLNTPLHGLPVPAESEIVLEGSLYPEITAKEGPFGEWTGYYAGGVRDVPVMKVERVMYRNNPIMVGAIPTIPPSDINFYRTPIRSAMIWDELEKAGIDGVKGVWAHEVGGARMLNVIAVKQQYGGHGRQAGMIAANCHAGVYANKMVVVVDEDIDPTNLNEVVWAMLTRVDAVEDIQVLKNCWSSKVDPTSYPEGKNNFNTRLVIDACRSWNKRESFPPTVSVDPEVEKKVREKFAHLFEREV